MEVFNRIFGWIVFVTVCFKILGSLLYFWEVASPFDSALIVYNSNPGIVTINIVSFIAEISFLASFLFKRKFQSTKLLKAILLISALAIAFLQWFELWYGSTFYYGEVRDKQGLFFSFTSAFLLTFVLLNIQFSNDEKRDFQVKTVLIILINLGLYLLYRAVYEPWRLWQS